MEQYAFKFADRNILLQCTNTLRKHLSCFLAIALAIYILANSVPKCKKSINFS